MKVNLFTLVILSSIIFASCTKNDITEETLIQSLSANEISATEVSGWQSGLQWNRTDSSGYLVFNSRFDVPSLTQEVLTDGAVIVFVKNILLDDNRRANKPIRIPFHVLPPMSRPGYDQKWYDENTAGSVVVKYRTNKHKFGAIPQVPDQEVEVKFFVISPNDLEKLDQTPVTISRLSYTELIQLFDAS